jgi:hypothetical protein
MLHLKSTGYIIKVRWDPFSESLRSLGLPLENLEYLIFPQVWKVPNGISDGLLEVKFDGGTRCVIYSVANGLASQRVSVRELAPKYTDQIVFQFYQNGIEVFPDWKEYTTTFYGNKCLVPISEFSEYILVESLPRKVISAVTIGNMMELTFDTYNSTATQKIYNFLSMPLMPIDCVFIKSTNNV